MPTLKTGMIRGDDGPEEAAGQRTWKVERTTGCETVRSREELRMCRVVVVGGAEVARGTGEHDNRVRDGGGRAGRRKEYGVVRRVRRRGGSVGRPREYDTHTRDRVLHLYVHTYTQRERESNNSEAGALRALYTLRRNVIDRCARRVPPPGPRSHYKVAPGKQRPPSSGNYFIVIIVIAT